MRSGGDSDYAKSGEGVPAVFIGNTSLLCVTFPLNGDVHKGTCGEKKVEIKTWYTLVVSSVMEGSQVNIFIQKSCTDNLFQAFMIVELNNEVLLKSSNSFPRVFEEVKISFYNHNIPSTLQSRYILTRPIFNDDGVEIHGDLNRNADVYIKNLHLKSFPFPELK